MPTVMPSSTASWLITIGPASNASVISLLSKRSPISRDQTPPRGMTETAYGCDGNGVVRHRSGRVHQDRPDIVDVGERRAAQQQVARGREERGGVVVGEKGGWVQPKRAHPGKSILVNDGACRIVGAARAAMGAVGIGRERGKPGGVFE